MQRIYVNVHSRIDGIKESRDWFDLSGDRDIVSLVETIDGKTIGEAYERMKKVLRGHLFAIDIVNIAIFGNEPPGLAGPPKSLLKNERKSALWVPPENILRTMAPLFFLHHQRSNLHKKPFYILEGFL